MDACGIEILEQRLDQIDTEITLSSVKLFSFTWRGLFIKEVSVKIGDKTESEKRELLEKCAQTSLNSKIISK